MHNYIKTSRFIAFWLNKGRRRLTRRQREREKKMGYVLRVRFAAFFAGAAAASLGGLYVLHKDYKIAHESIANQIKSLHESLDGRISAIEQLKPTEVTPAEASE